MRHALHAWAGGVSSAPLNPATDQKEMALAPDLTPHGRRERRDASCVNADRPSRPSIRKQTHLQYFAAAAWADHRNEPQVFPLAHDVERPFGRPVGQLLDAHGAVRWRPPCRPKGRTPVREFPPMPFDEPYHDASLFAQDRYIEHRRHIATPNVFRQAGASGPVRFGVSLHLRQAD